MKTYRMIICACMVTAFLVAGCRNRTELIGTVGNPVDLGLSVLWADHNLGGECVTNSGMSLTITTKGKKKVVDTAKYMCGGAWHSSTIAQMKELTEECDWRNTTKDGVEGFIVTGRNGNTIFLPRYSGNGLDYWTSEIDKDHTPYIGFMYMNNKYVDMSFSMNNWRKHIRPVMRNKHYRKKK